MMYEKPVSSTREASSGAEAAVARPPVGAHPAVPSLREFVRDALLERIARGQLAAGERVVEAALVSEYAISATPVREAIRELVAMGVLEARNHKGASVRQVLLEETIEAFVVRAALEALAARAAVPLLGGRCGEIRRTARAIIESAKRRDFSAFQEHNQSFHRAIVAGAANSVLLKTWDSLFFQVRTRWTMDYLRTFDPVAIAREHLPIVDAIESGNAELAASLISSHSNHLVAFLNEERRARALAASSTKPAGDSKGRPTSKGK